MTATKLPTSTTPLIQDLDLAAAVEAILAPYDGKRLERAQAACRKVHSSAVMGNYTQIVEAYRDAITEAVGGG